MKESIQSQANSNALLSRKQRWRRWATRRWLFPALYLTTAAAVLSVLWFYDQGSTNPSRATEVSNQRAGNPMEPSSPNDSPVNATSDDGMDEQQMVMAEQETLQWPVANRNELNVVLPFYRPKSEQPAMVTYQDTVRPHVGVDFARADQKSFDVLAAMSGKVKLVVQDPLVGMVIELEHENGISTVYQSLADVSVKMGQLIKQGEKIAQAGRNELEKKQGVHLHYEVRKNGEPVDPEQETKVPN